MIKTIFGLFCLCAVSSAIDTNNLLLLDKYREDFFEIEQRLWRTLGNIPGKTKEELPEVSLVRKFEEFGDKLAKDFPLDFFPEVDIMNENWAYTRLSEEVRGIKALYGAFRRFQKQQTTTGRVPSPQRAWTDLAETILEDPKSSVIDSLFSIYELSLRNDLFNKTRKEAEGVMRCEVRQSSQQILFNLYNTIILAELRGYTMVQFSYMLLKLYEKGKFTTEIKLSRQRYQERTYYTLEAIKEAMSVASKELWKCDAARQVEGETYVEVTNLLQGYIQNEVDLNPDGTCRESCTEYSYTKSYSCYQNLWCRQQKKCEGRVIKCQYFDADMWICPAENLNKRRYEYVEYENGRVLGRKLGCRRGTSKVDSWWRWLFWRCSYCFCLCDDPNSDSDRYFNMRPYVSDTKNNKVVTGLRFVKKNGIIHLQIEQGQLMGRAIISNHTVGWLDVHNYKISDSNVRDGIDYHMLTWEKRSMDLDDLKVDENHVITGVRFKLIGSHLNFEIQITPFNFTTGKLIDPVNRSIWKDNPNTDASSYKPRTEVTLRNPDIPTRIKNPSVPLSKHDQYVRFTNTDLDRDAGQTTVPFLDAQPVVSLVPVPLSGAGIFYKGYSNSGGYVAPKIFTYDYSKHLSAFTYETKK